MTDTTSILDLPSNPTIGGNISVNINEIKREPINDVVSPNNFTLDQTTINQIVNGLQQASSTGATLLPSRDIPQNTQSITNDPNIQANYIPQPLLKQKDYINEYENNESIIEKYNKKEKKQDFLDDFYQEFQTPLLLAILYFLFQLPIIRKQIFYYLPFLFYKDGNFNINGFIFTSVMFGFYYYLLNKSILQFNAF